MKRQMNAMRGWGILAALLIGLTGIAVADPAAVSPGQPATTAVQTARRSPHACNADEGPGVIEGHLLPEPGPGATTSLLMFAVSEAGDAYLKALKASLDHLRAMVAFYRDPNLRREHPLAMMGLIETQPASFDSKVDPNERQELWRKAKVALLDEQGRFVCPGIQPGSYYLLVQVRKEIPTPRYMANLIDAKRITQKTYYAMSVAIPTVPATQRVLVRARHFLLLGEQPPGDAPPPGAATPSPR